MIRNKESKTTIRIIVFSFIAIFLIWLYGLSSFVKEIPTEITDPNRVTDGIVILTGGSSRLSVGIDLLNKGRAKRLLVSGVGKDTRIATMLILSGSLPDNVAQLVDKIDLGYEAKNTKGNAIEAAKWIKDNNYKSIRLVTANYHMSRSILAFNKQMPDIELIAHPVAPKNFSLDHWWRRGSSRILIISEYNKYLISWPSSLL